jgi:dephospho-CoA kinase
MLRIALTGGIATGKSHCLARLAALGVPVIDSDVIARDVVRPGTDGLAAVASRFGSTVLTSDGSLDRQALADVVFSDAAARRDLEAIVHPRVFRKIAEWFASLPPAAPLAVADIPLLYETGREREFDRVIVASCTPAQQLERLLVRDGLSGPAAQQRLAAQLPIGDKVARADYVIDTSGTVESTDQQVVDVWESLKQWRGRPGRP